MNNKQQVLVVDDETNLRESLAELIESENFRVVQARDGAEAVTLLREGKCAPDVVFLDVRMPRMDGFQTLELIREESLTNAPVIIISAYSASNDTIEAMRRGAYDYITKPLDLDEIISVLHRAAEQHKLNQQAADARQNSAATDALENASSVSEQNSIIGTSARMRDVFKQIGRVAATDASVLVTGESGTGKELVARSIHFHSARGRAPFVAVNCGALPENLIESELFGYERGAFTGADKQKKGRFELADKGTLFLDEVGELSSSAQVKLLRALQERRFERVGGTSTINVDVRVIAATNKDLAREVAERRFREDLFYRLNVVAVRLPALRERLADVPQLAEYFAERSTTRHRLPAKTLSDDALRSLMAHDFPGNVRELENLIERAVVTSGANTGGVILSEHLFDNRTKNASASDETTKNELLEMPFHTAIAWLERELIRRALETTKGNRAEAARRLDINRRLLYSKLEEHKLS